MASVPKAPAVAERDAFYRRMDGDNLAPLWEVLHALVPPQPQTPCVPACWNYKAIRPYTILFVLMVLFGRNLFLVFVAIGAINRLDMARIVRGQTLALRQREFVQAAILCGTQPLAIIRRHIVPNLLGVVAVYATLIVPQVILI